MNLLETIAEQLQTGHAKAVKELVQQALEEGYTPQRILEDGLIAGMEQLGEKFRLNEVFVPEVLVASRAMNMGMHVLKPKLIQDHVVPVGCACLGTVQGDLHDIGKNLVRMMLESRGFEVIDLGTDVPPKAFIDTAIEHNCQLICCSALLTTTMNAMQEVVKLAEKAGIRNRVKIMVGGAPVTQAFADSIGADAYTFDAAGAAETAVQLCKKGDFQ